MLGGRCLVYQSSELYSSALPKGAVFLNYRWSFVESCVLVYDFVCILSELSLCFDGHNENEQMRRS